MTSAYYETRTDNWKADLFFFCLFVHLYQCSPAPPPSSYASLSSSPRLSAFFSLHFHARLAFLSLFILSSLSLSLSESSTTLSGSSKLVVRCNIASSGALIFLPIFSLSCLLYLSLCWHNALFDDRWAKASCGCTSCLDEGTVRQHHHSNMIAGSLFHKKIENVRCLLWFILEYPSNRIFIQNRLAENEKKKKQKKRKQPAYYNAQSSFNWIHNSQEKKTFLCWYYYIYWTIYDQEQFHP